MKFRGGIRYGNSFPDAIGAVWPLAGLTVDKEALLVSLPWRSFRLPRPYVSRLIKVSGHIAVGIQIEHTILEHPNLLVFWTYQFGAVKSCLEENGYSFSGRR
jgi:hypothetical protein